MHQPTQSSQQTNQVEEVENYGKTPHHTSQLITPFNLLYRLLKTVRFSQQVFLTSEKKLREENVVSSETRFLITAPEFVSETSYWPLQNLNKEIENFKQLTNFDSY